MNEFEQFVSELDLLPKIDQSFVYIGDNRLVNDGVEVKAMAIRLWGKEREEVEKELMERSKQLINGNKAWIRRLPEVISAVNPNTNEEGYQGFARISVSPK